MSGFHRFLGNEHLISRLRQDIAAGRLSHAYIIEGARGTGKRTLARLICAAASCQGEDRPCMECLNCSKIMRGQSPDVIFVTPEKGRVQLGVDVIRRLREDAVFAANDLPTKFYIFPDADAMNVQAQNALLKILEEPPAGVMFLLLSESAENLLATIRSRAPTIRLHALSDAAIEAALLADEKTAALKQTDPRAFHAAVKLARGSLGVAMELTDSGRAADCLELYDKAERYVELLAERRSGSAELAFYEYASHLVSARQREKLAELFELLADAIRDLCHCKLSAAPKTIFFADTEKAQMLAERFALSQLMRLCDIFINARQSLDRNVNLSLIQVQTVVEAASAGRSKL